MYLSQTSELNFEYPTDNRTTRESNIWIRWSLLLENTRSGDRVDV